MHLFLTSSPCDDNVPAGVRLPCILDAANGFVSRLRACWKPDSNMVIVAADPHNVPLNEEMKDTFYRAFLYHNLTISSMTLIDARNERDAAKLIALSDCVMLAGGHVPTEMAFFNQLGLKNLLRDYTGVVIGISAGTMNCARTVYVQPEEPGESHPDFRRFAPGMGVTRFQILPHYQKVKDNILDGKRLFEDVTYADSMGHTFFALPDGSYIYQDHEETTLLGKGYRLKNGIMEQLTGDGDVLNLANIR